MDAEKLKRRLKKIEPRRLEDAVFVRAYNTRMITYFKKKYLFDSRWSYERGYRYNFKRTHPVMYLAGDQMVASAEIGPRTFEKLLLPFLQTETDPFIYFSVKVTARVLDLTDQDIRRQLGIRLSDLLISTDEWDKNMGKGIWATTHEIGRLALSDDRFDGILYPPYPVTVLIKLRGKNNLAVFMDPDSTAMASPRNNAVRLEVIDKGNILKDLGLIF